MEKDDNMNSYKEKPEQEPKEELEQKPEEKPKGTPKESPSDFLSRVITNMMITIIFSTLAGTQLNSSGVSYIMVVYPIAIFSGLTFLGISERLSYITLKTPRPKDYNMFLTIFGGFLAIPIYVAIGRIGVVLFSIFIPDLSILIEAIIATVFVMFFVIIWRYEITGVTDTPKNNYDTQKIDPNP